METILNFLIESESFDKSKVTGNDGKLLIVYHGTDYEFETFNPSPTGIWFISDKDEAREYGKYIGAYQLNIVNPYYGTHEENAKFGKSRIINKAKSNGHDGIVLPKDEDFYEENIYYEAQFDVFIVFEPRQIKSVGIVSES